MSENVLIRRFGVAKLSGKSHFHYEQLVSYFRKKSECSEFELNWDAPDSMKKVNMFATNIEAQQRVVASMKNFFEVQPFIYFYIRLESDGKNNFKWNGNFIQKEEQFHDWIDEQFENEHKLLPAFAVWTNNSNILAHGTKYTIVERVLDICPKAGIIKVDIADI